MAEDVYIQNSQNIHPAGLQNARLCVGAGHKLGVHKLGKTCTCKNNQVASCINGRPLSEMF